MFIAEPQILLQKAQAAWDGFVNRAVAKYDTLDQKIGDTGSKFEKVSGRIGKAAQITNQLIDTGAKALAKYPELFGETGEAVAKALPDIKEATTQTGEWALAGAAIGSVVPGIGTGMGAIAGATASVALSAWDWYNGTKAAREEAEKVAALQDDEWDKTYKKYLAQQKEQADAQDKFTKDMAESFSKSIREGFEKNAEEREKAKGGFAAIKTELEEIVDLQKEWNDLIEALGEKPQIKEVITGLGRQKSAFDIALGSRSSEVTGDTAPELMGPASQELEDFSLAFDMDAVAQQRQEEYDKAVAQYEDYASMMLSITSELTSQIEENIAQGNGVFEGMGAAAEAGVASVLKQLSKMWGAKAIGELAEGLAALASPITAPTAGAHFASAAAFGAAAAATGFGGAVLAGDARRRGSQGAPDSAPASGLGGDSGTRQLAPIVINFQSTVPPTEREAQEAAAKVSSLLDKGARR